MNIDLKSITVRELVDKYVDKEDEGVFGFGGKLDIRPPYQRAFIYDDDKRAAVIESVMRGYPLNVMYWAVRSDGRFEIIDGQQRTISLCEYVEGNFSHKNRSFHNLEDDERKNILDYKLSIYRCSGNDSEKLDWFKTINIAGEELSNQELRNAVYHGSWVSDAKRYFSKSNCAAYKIASHCMSGDPIRQHYLETAIKWISDNNIEGYMGKHQNEKNASLLWNHFQSVISWVGTTFTENTKYMKNVDWGSLYRKYGKEQLDSAMLRKEIKKLLLDEDVNSKSGIYPYVLTRDEKWLHLRAFPDRIKLKVYEQQGGRCKKCDKQCDISEMEGDHITPWIEGGHTTEDNCQMLCKNCNRRKSSK